MLDVSLYLHLYSVTLYTSTFIIFYITLYTCVLHECTCIYININLFISISIRYRYYVLPSTIEIESPAVERSGERSCINTTIPGTVAESHFTMQPATSILCLFVCLQAKVVFVFEENKDNTTLLLTVDDTITQLHSNENYS